jgi:hypothetical protein
MPGRARPLLVPVDEEAPSEEEGALLSGDDGDGDTVHGGCASARCHFWAYDVR